MHEAPPRSAGKDSHASTSPRSTTRAVDLQPAEVADDGADSDTESFKDAVEGGFMAHCIAVGKEQCHGNRWTHASMHAPLQPN